MAPSDPPRSSGAPVNGTASNGAFPNNGALPDGASPSAGSAPDADARDEGAPGAAPSGAPEAGARFRPLVVGALYPGIARGLHADVLAARALGGLAYPVCTAHVVASHGRVTDVLAVPTDTVSAQLEHVFALAADGAAAAPTCAKLGIVSDAATVEAVFRQMERLQGPFVLDLTLSGPSGEDIIGGRGLDALVDHLGAADLVAVRRTDAELVAGMAIPSLDDAQVAVQRIAQRGARRVLLRCGRIATHHFDQEGEPPNYAVDLLYDGEEFALYEAPHLAVPGVHGASSALLLAALRRFQAGVPLAEALQTAKAYATEALRACQSADNGPAPAYVWDVPNALNALDALDAS